MLQPFHAKRSYAAPKYAVLDIESNNGGEGANQFLMMGFYDGKEYYPFWQGEFRDFMKLFLSRKYRGWTCFAHNGRKFDFQFVVDLLDKMPEYSLEFIVQGGIVELGVTDKHGDKWYFKDSLRILKGSLDAVTRDFGVEHQKLVEIDSRNLEKYERSVVVKYNRHDCLGLYEAIQKYVAVLRPMNIPIKSTIASQAIMAFRTTMKAPIPQLNRTIENFVRMGYCGGRVDIFRMHCNSPINIYDVNSLYPSVMAANPMPVGRPVMVTEMDDKCFGFYHVHVKVPVNLHIPPLPVKVKHKLIFPVGKLTGVFSTPELRMAESMGCTFEINRGFEFRQEPIFEDFVKTFYKKKQESVGAARFTWKSILNAAYGKFAQGRTKNIYYRLPEGESIEGHAIYDEEHRICVREKESRAGFIIPSISSAVTSYSRVALMKLLTSVKGTVYYCDTDSLATDAEITESDELGGLKLEHTGDKSSFVLPKLYALKNDKKNDGRDLIRAKGFHRDFASKLVYDDFEDALRGDFSAFRQDVAGLVTFNQAIARNKGFLDIIRYKKSVKTSYDKRERIGKTFKTRPWKMEMW